MLNDFDVNSTLIDELNYALKSPHVRPSDLGGLLILIFTQQAVVKKLTDHVENYRIKNFQALLQDKSLNWNVLNLDLFLEMLITLTALGENNEKLFTALRFHMLESLDEKSQTFPYLRELLPFLAALACQCFVNEYVYWEEPEEKQKIAALGKKIESRLSECSAFEVAVYACYKPLLTLSNPAEIETQFDPNCLNRLLRMQISEPLEEEKIKSQIKVLTSIDDDISKLVKDQYEVNPYPAGYKHPSPAGAISKSS